MNEKLLAWNSEKDIKNRFTLGWNEYCDEHPNVENGWDDIYDAQDEFVSEFLDPDYNNALIYNSDLKRLGKTLNDMGYDFRNVDHDEYPELRNDDLDYIAVLNAYVEDNKDELFDYANTFKNVDEAKAHPTATVQEVAYMADELDKSEPEE